MAEPAATACRRCREQKLRCSRERPECVRCARLGSVCSYPPPPDRKLLASKRALARNRRQTATASSSESKKYNADDQFKSTTSDISTPQDTHTTKIQTETPSRDVQDLLRSLYFLCTFNSSLLFHRPTFDRMLDDQELPTMALLAVCAMGTVYLNSSSAKSAQPALSPSSIEELKTAGRQWALCAGKEALRDIDQPTLEAIQTCAVLGLYWFAVGERSRNAMFAGIAYRGIRELRSTRKEFPSAPSSVTKPAETSSNWLQSEMMNRCFWSIWVSNCVNSDHYITGSSADTQLIDVALPADEESFILGKPGPRFTLSDTPSLTSTVSSNSASPTTSVMAEMIRLVHIWVKIRDHIESRKKCSVHVFLAELSALDQQLLHWVSQLPSTFAYSKRNLLVLHSTLVPQFSGLPLQDAFPRDNVRLSAEIALKSATAISGIAADLIALEWDPAQMAPFFGYCMYVSASIHIAFIFSRKPDLAQTARSGLLSNIQLLKSMKAYWRNLDRLWERIHLLYKINAEQYASSSYANHESLSISDTNANDVDEIAFVKRETGELAEPLAESVLQYSLQGLQRLEKSASDLNDTSRSIQELENAFHTDRIVAAMTSGIWSQSAVQTPTAMKQRTTDNISPTETTEQMVSDSSASAFSPDFDVSGQHDFTNFETGFAIDWLDPSLEILPSVFSSCDELFGADNSWIE